MLFKEINQKFTEKVAEYIAKGYSINAGTMSGSQGEIAHVDFTDGKDVYRILLERTYVDRADYYYLFGCDMIRLVVGKNTDKVTPNMMRDMTIWNNNLDIIEEEDFYEIGSRRDDEKYYGTMEEAQAAAQKRHSRYENRKPIGGRTENITSDKTVDIVLPYVKKRMCGKRVNRNQIEVSKRHTWYGDVFYQINYFSNSWVLG